MPSLLGGSGVLAVPAPFTAANVVRWFTAGAQWHGSNGIPHRVTEHLVMSGAAVLTALLVALPVGLLLGHTGRGGNTAINVANAGRAIPSLALLVVGFELLKGVTWFGLGALPAYFALVALAIPPIILNSVVGLRQVDPQVKEAAPGHGHDRHAGAPPGRDPDGDPAHHGRCAYRRRAGGRHRHPGRGGRAGAGSAPTSSAASTSRTMCNCSPGRS